MSRPKKLEQISRQLAADLNAIDFAPPVAYVYNPLDYAWGPYRQYVQRFGGLGARNLLLGMNPGPWGMAQTGVPFGTVSWVRDWLELSGEVGKPPSEHPKRLVQGFDCPREEVSGARVWGWARDTFGPPERFFERFFVGNYCPLQFLADTGRNLTPDKLAPADRQAVEGPCDEALRQMVETLEPERVIGIGAFAEGCARRVLADFDLEIARILHPSPASPIANRGWAEAATRQLRELGIELPGA